MKSFVLIFQFALVMLLAFSAKAQDPSIPDKGITSAQKSTELNSATALKGKDEKAGIEKAYADVAPTGTDIDVTNRKHVKKYLDKMGENYQKLREAANNANLTIHQRMVGIRIAQKKAREELKKNFNKDLDAIQADATLSPEDQDKKVYELRNSLKKSALGLRTTSNREYRYVYYRMDTRTIKWFPSRNARFGQLYYSELKDSSYLTFLRSQFLTFTEDFGALSSELVAGYLGPFRMGLNTAITNAREEQINTADLEGKTDDEIQEIVDENYQKNLEKNTLATVVTGGGLLGIKAQYPLVQVNSIWSRYIKFDNELVGTLSGLFSTAGTTTPENEMNLWGSYGIENNLYIPLPDFAENDEEVSNLGFFFQYNIRHVSGSGTFEKSMGIDEGFWMGEFKTGLFYSGIQITYKYLNFSNKTIDGQFQNTFTIAYAPR